MDNGPEGKFSHRPWSLLNLKDIVNKWQSCMYDTGGWNALFLENHDQSRSISRFTPHKPENRAFAAKMLANFIGFQSGTLFIYQGQELGMSNLPDTWPISDYKDVETQNFYQLFVTASPKLLSIDCFSILTLYCAIVPWRNLLETRWVWDSLWTKFV